MNQWINLGIILMSAFLLCQHPVKAQTPEACKQLDIAFLIDSSGSINKEDKGNWDRVLNFVVQVINKFTFGPNAVLFGAVKYSNHGNLEFTLNQYSNKSNIINHIETLRYVDGRTNIAEALEIVRKEVFSPAGGDRPGVPNVVTLITDGEPNEDVADTIPQANLAKASDIFIITVGITNQINFPLLKNISSTGEVLNVSRFDQLDKITDQLKSAACEDVNDVAPVFSPGARLTAIYEDTPIGTTVFQNIVVTDQDFVNPQLSVSCVSQVQQYNPCDFFRLKPSSPVNSSYWIGWLELIRPLDYETKKLFQFVGKADDSVHNVYETFTVQVLNVPDIPPKFVGSMATTVPENSPRGTDVLRVTATDGDEGMDRKIVYSLINDFGYFVIDPNTGQINTTRPLDRENAAFPDGTVTLLVRATEEISPGILDGSPDATAIGTVTVTIGDVNDNGPIFTPTQVRITMDESIPRGATVPGLNMRVVDYDQGPNAQFQLLLLDYTDIFELQPSQGSGLAALGLRVVDPSKLDYDRGRRDYTLRVTAREINTPEQRQSQGVIYIDLRDNNDNAPVFANTSYQATLSELAQDGAHVATITATDLDSGGFGNEGLRYKLTGVGANNFHVGLQTGVITVANPSSCWKPGVAPCLDAETKDLYELKLVVTDNYAEGLQTSVPVTIRILDVNDNVPTMEVSEYVSSITEGSIALNEPITVKATDLDNPSGINHILRYSIIGGDPDQLFQIDPQSGVLTPKKAIPYPETGHYLLTVEARDPDNRVTTTVRIIVKDINNHAPVFQQNGLYAQTIREDTAPGSTIETVRATDGDSGSTSNGVVRYRITSGGRGKFAVESTTGVISVTPGSSFDYEIQNRYVINIVAEDQGDPKLSSNATLVVNILDANNKNPYFQPSTRRADVYENQPLGYTVTKMTAFDPDSNALLRYFIQEPIKAWDSKNMEITNNPYKGWFRIGRDTGDVVVNGDLNRDQVIRWSAAVRVVDTNGIPQQTATGSIVITVLDVNEQPPVFGPPWSPTNPNIDINVREGQGPGAFVTLLTASDPSDSIDKYVWLSNPGRYFKLNEDTGVITISKPLDYEQTSFTQFVVAAVDDGQPPLSSTATFNVNIININDETPAFTQRQYETAIQENSPGGFPVLRVQATDADSGDYGVVRYTIDDPQNRFDINPTTGWITVAQGAVLDRETTPLINIAVQAYDSPQNATLRKYSSLSRVQIALLDVDEFPPMFGEPTYTAVVSEKSPSGTSVIQLTASDEDKAPTNFIFQEQGGDPKDLFQVNATTGLISTKSPLENQAGTYNLSIIVRNNDQTSVAYVAITIIEIDNNPPVWTFPTDNNNTVSILENQNPGLQVRQVSAQDNDDGQNGVFDYGFVVNGKMVNTTGEFEINGLTGWITTLVAFDREEKDSYILQLIARDRGQPYMDAKRTLVVQILDVEDNSPRFPQYQNCCTIPNNVNISEASARGTVVGQVIAKDPDLAQAGIIIYTIEAGNDDSSFIIDSATGKITLNKTLDHEKQSKYTLRIRASNAVSGDPKPVGSQCAPTCLDPSTMLLNVIVLDVNEKAPEFSNQVFNACVAVNAPIDKSVTTMAATDPDKGSSEGVVYNITRISLNDSAPASLQDSYKIGWRDGVVRTNMLMELYRDNHFSMNVLASDTKYSTTAQLRVWVTPPAKEVKVTINEVKTKVEANLNDYVKQISERTGFGIVCVNSIRYHTQVGVGGSGVAVNISRTDMYLHVIDPKTLVIQDAGTVSGKVSGLFTGGPVLGAATQWAGFIRDPVLIAIIVVAVLLFLALLALCCICYFWAALCKKKKYVEAPKIINAGTINPVWKGYEDQELSMAVADADAKLEASPGFVNKAYEEETRTANKTTANGYIASHEEINIQEATKTSASNAMPHIEAELAGGAVNTVSAGVMANGSVQAASVMSDTMNRGIQTDEPPTALNTSMELPVTHPTRIGATLSTSNINLVGTSASPGAFDFDHFGNQMYSSESINLRGPSEDVRPAPQVEPRVSSDHPDSFYQGEIHLGSLPPPRSMTRAQVPASSQQYQFQETQFSETRQYKPASQGNYDSEIEYISF